MTDIKTLEKQISEETDFTRKMELKDELLELKRKQGKIKPPDQDIECFGCGS